MKTLLSLYDYTGNWAEPFANAGWNVILWDIKHQCNFFDTFCDIMDASADYFYEFVFDNWGTVDGIIAAQPCTDFAVSGAKWFAKKDADGSTAFSIELVHQTLRIIDLCQPFFWCLENPISRIHSLVPELGTPRMYFHPYEFGDPYTKKTALYGEFSTQLVKTPVEPVLGSIMHTKYGGKSEKTKAARSATPKGFANAFCQAQLNSIDEAERNFLKWIENEIVPSRKTRS